MSNSFGETLLSFLKDKQVEIYASSSSKQREYADYSVSYKEVIRGTLREATGDLMILEVSDHRGNTNLVYVNCWTVTAVIEPKNGISIVDVYCDEHKKQVK